MAETFEVDALAMKAEILSGLASLLKAFGRRFAADPDSRPVLSLVGAPAAADAAWRVPPEEAA